MKIFNILFLIFLLPFIIVAQVTTDPVIVTESGEVKVLFDATKGNQGLKGYTGDVYAHTGVITDQSLSGSDWKYAPSWGDNREKYKLVSLGNDLWQLTIAPDIRTYYGVPATENILKLAFVFRSGDTKKEGKGEGNTDIFVTLNEDVFIPSEAENKPRPNGLPDGINYVDGNTVILSLYAPEKEHVHLLGDFNGWKKDNDWQLYKDGDYWWTTVTELEAGREYTFQYLIDDRFKVADAYAEKILDPYNDKDIPSLVYPDLTTYPIQTEGIVSVMQTGKAGYNWKVTDFEPHSGEELVIYELLIRDFTEEGTVMAATEKLDYLKAMGINAIELMPIQEFDGNDSWGYNPCFYFAADKAYGTPDDYKFFIDQAHELGIAVILDVVFNHATSSHPFARMYWNSESDKPAVDNPWFNVDAPHPYSVFCDFNHEYTGTRDFFKKVLTYWLTEYKVDGFRLDLTKGFTQNKSTETTASYYDASRIAILKDYHSQIQKINPKAYTILEHFCENKEEKELADAGMFLWNNINYAYCQTAMGYKENSSLTGGSATSRGWTQHRLITYQESHDEERTMYKAKTWGISSIKSDEQTRMKQAVTNAAFLMCTPGPKMIWQFGELGYDFSIEENGRTGRKPVRWDYFEEDNRRYLYDYYSMLIDLRNQYPELFASPGMVVMETGEVDWDGGRRIVLQKDEESIVLAGNFTDKEIRMDVEFPLTGHWDDYFSMAEYVIEVTSEEMTKTMSIPAHSFNLYVRKDGGSTNESIEAEKECNIFLEGNHIIVESQHDIEQISLYSFGGKLYKTMKTNVREAMSVMNVSDVNKGIWLVTVRASSGDVFSRKISIR